jgi:hypothetical protein
MTDLLTTEQQAKIEALVQQMELTKGVGTKENACSVAAINLALIGELTDKIPDCMSEVIGKWIITIQDRMPDDMRNSDEWKRLLPLAAGTGRTKEPERLSIIMDWMWESLKLLQPFADANGFGEEWAAMCVQKSHDAANAANAAACSAAAYAAHAGAYAANAAAHAAAYSSSAAYSAAAAVAAIATAVAAAVTTADSAAAYSAAWQTINPPALLEKLINV